jgi:hypothetical protein
MSLNVLLIESPTTLNNSLSILSFSDTENTNLVYGLNGEFDAANNESSI